MSLRLAVCYFGFFLICPPWIHAEPLAEQDMADRIDALLDKRIAVEGVLPSPRASDAEFLRRAWLDLTGIIPPINEGVDTDDDNQDDEFYGVRGFLKDQRPDKRERLINFLLSKTTHANHFSNIWKNVMLPEDGNVQRLGGDAGFRNWLYGKFQDNVPYDEMVRELLLAAGQSTQTGPALFYTSLQLKPEELAASTSRIFLGTQIQCAQCHDHPFDHWTRKDFWGYAAFFARLQRPANNQQFFNQVSDATEGEVKIPDTEEVVRPQYLGGQVSPENDQTRRQRLADWLTSPDNPFFARATVNRAWSLLFGRGIVDPADDIGAHNEPSHPELLNEMAEYFVETGFDLDRLIRTLAFTRAYQRSSQTTGEEVPAELFAHMAIKSLTAEQLYDCLAEGMRKSASATTQQTGIGFRGFDQNRQVFLLKFRAPTQGATEFESGIPQALTLMNGTMVRQATDLRQSDILVSLQAPFFTDEGRVETLFLSTLSRFPSDEERAKFIPYVESGGPDKNKEQALGDVLWALLNSAEFILNH